MVGSQGGMWLGAQRHTQAPAENSGGTPVPGSSLVSEINGNLTKEVTFEQIHSFFCLYWAPTMFQTPFWVLGYSSEQERQKCLQEADILVRKINKQGVILKNRHVAHLVLLTG